MNPETLIVGGAPCILEPFRADLIARAKRVVAVDGGGDVCFAAGRIPDVLIGDMDSISNEAHGFALSGGSRILELRVRKDVTDLEAALELAHAEEWMAPILTAVLGGRSDHELAVWGSLVAAASLQPLVSEPTILAAVLSSKGRTTFELDGPGRTFSLLSTCGPVVVSAQGVEYPLDHGILGTLTGQGVSNRVTDQAVITVHDGTLLLIAEETQVL